MSIAHFEFTDRARPIVELGIGDSRMPSGQAVWDTARWDDPAAKWADTEPTWMDITCNTLSYRCQYGRQRITDRFVPGVASVIVTNATGWADPNATTAPGVLGVRPGRSIRLGVIHAVYGYRCLFRGIVDAMTPVYDPDELDVVALDCVDVLGEVNRVKLTPNHDAIAAGDTVTQRVARILDRAEWSPVKRDLSPTSDTVIADTMGGQVADLLGQAADSGGGSVFGDYEGRIAYRPRDWQTYVPGTPPDGTIGNVEHGRDGYWTAGTTAVPAYLDPAVGTVTVPYTAGTGVTVTADPPAAATYWRVVGANAEIGRNPAGTLYPGTIRSLELTQTAPAYGAEQRLTFVNNIDNYGSFEMAVRVSFVTAGRVAKVWYRRATTTQATVTLRVWNAGGTKIAEQTHTTGAVAADYDVALGTPIAVTAGQVLTFSISAGATTPLRGSATTVTSPAGVTHLDTRYASGGVGTFPNTVLASSTVYISPVYEPASVGGGDAGFRFDAAEYPGTGLGYTDPRGDLWTLSAPGAVVPTVPEIPPVWVPPVPGDVCPTRWERPFERADIATRVIIGRDVTTAQQLDDPPAQVLYGIEPFERTDLLTESDSRITMLGQRILRVRSAATAPRVRSVSFDASTSDNALDLMSTVDVYRPSRYRCRLQYPRGTVFDAEHFATGVAHDITPDAWTLDLNLDSAAPFAAAGGRWDQARWDQSTWADVVRLRADAAALLEEISA
jgi:hypothetical protein